MGMDRHVGRVGALAVALGIGSAIVAMPGVAWAESDGASTAAAASPGTDAGPTGTKTVTKPLQKRGHENAGEAVAGAGPCSTPSDVKPAKTKRSSITKPDTGAGDSRDDTTTNDVAKPARRVIRHTPVRNADAPASTGKPTATDITAAAVESVKNPTAPKLTAALTTLFSPKATPSPADSPDSPLLWTMLASVRRQFGEQPLTTLAATPSSISATTADAQAAAAFSQISGQAYQSPIVASDGTIYQVTAGMGSARVFILDENAQVLASSGDIDGYLRGDVVTRPDGTLVVITSNQRGNRSSVSAVDSSGTVTTIARITGSPDIGELVGANGALYFSTDVPKPFGIFGATIPYRYVRITPTNAVQTFPPNTTLALDDNGSAYLVSSQYGASTLRVFNAGGATKTIPLPYGSTTSAPILGQDGTVYVTVGVQDLFGAKTTRVYTVNGTTSAVRTVTGLPGATVVSPDGLYVETVTDTGSRGNGTETTYLSRVTGTGAQTSDPITGRVAGYTFQVTPDGTVYAPITDPSLNTGAVAVVAPDGTVTTTPLPGSLVTRTIRADGAATTGSQNVGYVNYSAGGTDHVAVLNPDGAVARTIDLPAGATASTVFFGADGAAYELLDYYGPDDGQTTARQIVALATGTYTANVPGRGPQGSDDVEFSPNGIGYLLIGTPAPDFSGTQILGFDSAGNTVIPLSEFPDLVDTFTYTRDRGYEELSFAPNGTSYVLNYATDSTAGVYALTSSGAQRVLDVNRAGGTRATAPTFTADGTGFVTIGGADGGTIVLSFPTVTTL